MARLHFIFRAAGANLLYLTIVVAKDKRLLNVLVFVKYSFYLSTHTLLEIPASFFEKIIALFVCPERQMTR